jgi:hypothetical protein
MAVTVNSKGTKVLSEQDAQKVATYNTLFDEVDAEILGMLSLGVGGSSNVTLTRTQALNRVFKFTGVLTGAIVIFFPVSLGCARDFIVWNATTGAFSLTVKTTAGGSTGIVVAQARSANLFHDGTNVWRSTADTVLTP